MIKPIIPFCLIFSIFFCNVASSASIETNLCIKNYTSADHIITVDNINNYDWDGNSRPDKNLNNITIKPFERICQREELNSAGNGTFTLIIDNIPSRVAYKPIERYTRCSAGNCNTRYSDSKWGVFKNTINPILHGYNTIYWQPEGWWYGYECAVSRINCSELAIK
jgi:hypothetical protein